MAGLTGVPAAGLGLGVAALIAGFQRPEVFPPSRRRRRLALNHRFRHLTSPRRPQATLNAADLM